MVKLKNLINEEETFKLKKKDGGNIVVFKNKDNYEKALKSGEYIDPINKGPYILESLKIDKNLNKTDALNDIYKVLRPGEAPSVEIAEEIFNNLYFKKERYDLSEVGRVKLNSKLDYPYLLLLISVQFDLLLFHQSHFVHIFV